MTKKIGDKKIQGVGSTKATKDIEQASEVTGVTGIRAASGVGATQAVGGIGKRGPTRTMSLAEREQLFQMVDQEAKKLFGDAISSEKRKLVEDAVKMAIDSGLVDEGAESGKKGR